MSNKSSGPELHEHQERSVSPPVFLQDAFVGLDLHTQPASSGKDGLQDVQWSSATSDGFAILHTRDGVFKDLDLRPGQGGVEEVVFALVRALREFAGSQGLKIHLVSVAGPVPACFLDQNPRLFPALWQKLDAIPFLIDVPSSSGDSPGQPTSLLPPPATSSEAKRKHIPFAFLPTGSDRSHADNRAQRAVKEAIRNLSPSVRSATPVDVDGQTSKVEVDRAGQVVLASLENYEATTSKDLWKQLIDLSSHLKRERISVSFFSATPQGGGVALMRSALVRLWNLLGCDVKWFVPEGHPAIFDITKRKMHNVLQGVNTEGAELEDREKEMFEEWTKENLDTFWMNGPLKSRVIVIDDPQLSALIPHLRKFAPDAKIIFRSHIQIDSSLVNDPSAGGGVHAAVWSYLWSFVKEADIFVAHPVKHFVPKVVLESSLPVVYMAPSSDPLDGLNKPIGLADLRYYQEFYNRLSRQQCGSVLDWSRPYIVQVARFDPSKGIPILLDAYLSFRKQLGDLNKAPSPKSIPQLVLCGHGSVDDPDGQPIYDTIKAKLAEDDWKDIKHDVSFVRAPPCDRTLGAILQGAWCATQLSTKEGFEVKVTEAVHKRIPIIASRAGGIPLQIKDGVNGWLVDSGDYEAVASRFLDLFRSDTCPLPTVSALEKQGETPASLADRVVSDLSAPPPPIDPREAEGEQRVGTSEDFWTVGNAVKWMVLFGRLCGGAGGRSELEGLLGEKGGFEEMEGRDVWETIHGREDGLVID